MTINDKINLLLRMQLCRMQGSCYDCPLRDDSCNVHALIDEAVKALREGEDPAEEKARIEDMVADILIDLGCPGNGEGYYLLIEAITYLVKNPTAVNQAHKDLYTHVGESRNTTATKAERNMRFCIENAFDRCDYDTIIRYFGNSLHPDKGKPTTSEFVARIADIVRRKARRADLE